MDTAARTLEDVRSAIDALDAQIIVLLAQRSALVQQAVAFKRDEFEVPAPVRVAEVIEKVRGLATIHGMPPDVAEVTYRAMIGAFIDLEMQSIKDRPL